MTQTRTQADDGADVYVCDCGRVAKSYDDAVAHAEQPEWVDGQGRRQRHDHDVREVADKVVRS